MVTCNTHDKFLLVKLTEKVLRMVNFTNLKTQVIILQNQNPKPLFAIEPNHEIDYVIWSTTNILHVTEL